MYNSKVIPLESSTKKYKYEIGYNMGPLRRKHHVFRVLTVLACFVFETSRAQFLIHNDDDDGVGLTFFLVQRCAASAEDGLRFGVCGGRPTLLVLLDIHETP